MKKKILLKACFVSLAFSLLNIGGVNAQVNQDSIVNVAFGTVAADDLLGGVSTVNVPELLKKSYATYSLDGLQSLVGGFNGNIWGQGPLLLVDGVPRSLNDIRATEVESVTVLKGVNAVALYGSKAAKGVVLVTTKRGVAKPVSMNIQANTGFSIAKGFPKYLGAADYMTLYNEARVNDGRTELYSQEVIDATRSGVNPDRYPDVDYFNSEYLRKAANRTDVTAEIFGGNERTRYYSNFGATYNNGLVKYGEAEKERTLRFNVRSNVDMQLSSWLSASTDVAVVFDDSYNATGDYWGTANSLRPNWYAPLIPIDKVDPTNDALQSMIATSSNIIDGKYLIGGRQDATNTMFGNMLTGSYLKGKNRTLQFNARAKADLSAILEGLSFSSAYSMDYRNYYSESWVNQYAVYQPTWSTVDGVDMITGLTKYGNDVKPLNESVGSTTYIQTIALNSQFNYKRTFNDVHNVSASLIGWGFQIINSASGDNASSLHHNTNANLGFQAAYNFNRKYYVDFSGAYVHSTKLPEKNRNALSPTLSLGWRVSDEDFFKDNVSFVNSLKLNASYGKLNQDIDINNFYLYDTRLDYNGGWFTYRDGGYGGNTSAYRRIGNPDLTFVQREEYRLGLEGAVLDNLLVFDANYFLQYTNGLLARGANTLYPNFLANGDDNIMPWINLEKDMRTGIDFTVNINKKVGAVDLSLGLAGMYYATEALKRDELNEPKNKHLDRTGKPIDAYFGYVALGFFESMEDIANSPEQRFGGTLKPGDIKYKDINGDGWVDDKDQIDLGHNGWASSPFSYGINLTMKWKNLTFYAMGTGNTGAIGFKGGSYYQPRGENKYSEVVNGRWTEATKNTATYPRLTTLDDTNNYRNSTFWMYKTNRFDLNKVQITYDMPKTMFTEKSLLSDLSVYVSGSSLLTLSKERKLMETTTSGVYTRFFNLGLKASF